jgi:TRAP-type C4-dicarboxylate transport system permease small subunit
MIDRAIGRAIGAIEAALAVALLAAIVLNFANVIGRYVFAKSILGADEYQIYAMVWMAFVGAAVVAWRGEHLRMDALAQLLPAGLLRVLRVAELVLLLVLAGFVIVNSWAYTARMLGISSAVAGIPMWVPHGAVIAGYALLAIICVRHLARGARL